MYIHVFIQSFCLQKHHFHPRLLISEKCCFMTSNKKQVAGMNSLIMYSTSHSHHWKFYKTPPIPFEVSKNKNKPCIPVLSFTHLGSKFTDLSNNSHAFQHRAEAHMMIGVGTLLPRSRFSIGGFVGDVPHGDFR